MSNAVIGLAWFFERIVVYGPFGHVISLFRSKRMRNKAGEFLGVVKGLIPTDPSRVLYEYSKHTEGFKKRAWLRNRPRIKTYFRSLKREKREAHVWNDLTHDLEQKRKYAKQATLAALFMVESATQEATRLDALIGLWPLFVALGLCVFWVWFWDRRYMRGKF